jgi:hypothetical protein
MGLLRPAKAGLAMTPGSVLIKNGKVRKSECGALRLCIKVMKNFHNITILLLTFL